MPLAPEARAGRAGVPAGWVLLTLGVTLAHLWLANIAVPDSLGGGASAVPDRMAVAFVTELAPAAPPVLAPRPAAPPPRARRVAPPQPAASAPEPPPQPDPVPPAEPRQSESGPAPGPPPAPPQPPVADVAPVPVAAADPAASDPATVLAAPSPSEAASAAAPAVAFAWPPSTRLSYRLSGDYRGPVEGQARVEWLREGTRYQVHLDVSVGPSFAPLLSRRTSSEGEITYAGLRPERFDEATRVLLRDPRRLRIDMAGTTVVLANGNEVARPDGLQDTASQFVQLSWLFTNRPELLRPGQTVPMPLALPRRVQMWQYEVGEATMLDTPAGPVEAFHVRPRPDVASDARRGGELVPEAWFAPSLQYLPVRILIRQEGGNFVDLLIERLPQQAAPGR